MKNNGIFVLAVIVLSCEEANGETVIEKANKRGPYIVVVIPNLFEMKPLLNHPQYKASQLIIHFGGITTQLLLSLFDIEGVVHYGTVGRANPSLNTGDVVIPKYWSHSALWSWQRHGKGPEDELPLESNGDYTRKFGYLNIANYSTILGSENLLNNIWFQPEEVFPVDGTPEERQHIFWVPVDSHYFNLIKTLERLTLEECLDATTCLSTPPKVKFVERGTSASIYVDNIAYRNFIHKKFNVDTIIVIRSIGGDKWITLAANNSVKVTVEIIKLLSSPNKLSYVLGI